MRIFKKLLVMPVMMLACLMMLKMPAVQAAESKDFSELEYQIGVANGLESYEYTMDTWEVLESAVEAGNQKLARDAKQSEIEGAAEDIELAIENLVKMDYNELLTALDVIYEKIDENPETHDVWYRLDKAVDKARPLLVSGDQEAVDEMVQTLNALIEELTVCETAVADPDVIVQEVQVQVPPTEDFCNIPVHRIWLTLFLVSAALNVLLFAVLGYVLFKKRNAVDHTPLVHYDLDDDLYGGMDDSIYDDMDMLDETYNEENENM